MVYQLENEFLLASFKEAGAEICRLRNKKNGIEYLWNADPAVWTRHAPILFPIVGRLTENRYHFNEQEYSLPQHGFARDMEWKFEEKKDNSLTFSLQENEETLAIYPFSFQLKTVYSLQEDRLSITYQVQNNNREEMPFSIGAHPGFNCPLRKDEEFSDYYLEFEKPEKLERQLLNNGFRAGGKVPLPLQHEKELPLSQHLFDQDALVFEGVKSDWIAIKSRNHAHGLEVHIKGFPYLGIWAKPGGSEFLCIEPWYGVADLQGTQRKDIRQKDGIIVLPAEKAFSCTYSIRLF